MTSGRSVHLPSSVPFTYSTRLFVSLSRSSLTYRSIRYGTSDTKRTVRRETKRDEDDTDFYCHLVPFLSVPFPRSHLFSLHSVPSFRPDGRVRGRVETPKDRKNPPIISTLLASLHSSRRLLTPLHRFSTFTSSPRSLRVSYGME